MALEFEVGHKLWVSTEHDVGTATSHIGRNGYRSDSACACDDSGFTLVLLRIQYLVLDSTTGKHSRELFGLLNRDGADENWLASLVARDDIFSDSEELCGLGLVDQI